MVTGMDTVMVTVTDMEDMLVELPALSRDLIAVATIASVRRDGFLAKAMDMVRTL